MMIEKEVKDKVKDKVKESINEYKKRDFQNR